MENKLNTEEH